MPPTWLTWTAWASLAVASACALGIAADVVVGGYRQHMRVMESVWPITALYLGPLAAWAYVRWGRPQSEKYRRTHGDPPEPPFAVTTAIGVSHCGAGCTLGDVVGAYVVLLAGLELAGLALWSEYAVDYVLAFVLGIAFQYFAIVPMRGLDLRKGLVAAVKADALSLTSFELGMFAWMAIVQLVLFPVHHLHPDRAAYWLVMQVAMVLGFATAFPVNWWLIRRGTKEAM